MMVRFLHKTYEKLENPDARAGSVLTVANFAAKCVICAQICNNFGLYPAVP